MSDKPLICDRARFIDYANGILLNNRCGKIVSRTIHTDEAITEERWSGAPE